MNEKRTPAESSGAPSPNGFIVSTLSGAEEEVTEQSQGAPSLTPSLEAGSMASLLGALARTERTAIAPGTVVADQYRIERPIGEGGMGVVYLARDVTLDRDVAVKVCSDLSRTAIHRIQREAMALAKLAHPNVVVVFQAGELEQRFFIAMEYVAGGTATQWVASGRRASEVLAMYTAAGDGLAAAHEAGLLHRDFKPDNVLVGTDGRARVADFGLVQSIAAEPESTSSTGTHGIVGTPAYMPPEQWIGDDLDARADQYAFAASVWEALFGQRPTRAAIEDERVPAPAKWIDGAVPRHVVSVLRRALAEDREARWPSMHELLAGLRHDPTVRRRRVLGIGAAVVAVGGALVVRSLATPEVTPPCTEVAAAMDDAWNPTRAAALAEVVGEPSWTPIEVRVRGRVDDWVAQATTACRATRVDRSASEQVLDRRMVCLESRKHELQAILGVLESGSTEAIGNAATALDVLPAAAGCLTADALGTQALPTDPELRRRIDEAQAAVATSVAAALDPTRLDPLAAAERAVDLARATGWRPILVEALSARASALYERDRKQEAIATLDEAAHLALALGSDHAAVQIHADRAWPLSDLDRFGEAQQSIATARALWERTGRDPAAGQRMLGAVAHVALAREDPQEALSATTEQIVLARRAYGTAATAVALHESNLALALAAANRPDDAAAAIDRAISLARGALGDEHPRVARYQATAARLAVDAGDVPRAVDLATRALKLQERWYGLDDPRHIILLQTLSFAARRRGDYETAQALQTRALQIARSHDPSSPMIAEIQSNLAGIAVERGDFETAAPQAAQTLATLEKVRGVDSPKLITALLLVGYIARERPNPDLDASLRDLMRAHALAVEHLGADGYDAVNLDVEIAKTLVARGEATQAVPRLQARLEQLPGLDLSPEVSVEVQRGLAEAYLALGQTARACEFAEQAVADLRGIDAAPLGEALAQWRREHCDASRRDATTGVRP